jgi:hypothetical protein
MKIEMSLKDYFKEFDLVDMQYGQEEDYYPLINMILRENCNLKELSLRDVHNSAGAGKRKKLLDGYGHRPDLVILDKKYKPDKDKNYNMKGLMYCAVEVKTNNGSDKYSAFEEGNQEAFIGNSQILGQLAWYGKVIYTNGLCWQYLNTKRTDAVVDDGELIDDSKDKKITFNVKTICNLDRSKDNSYNEKQWKKLQTKLAKIKWKENDSTNNNHNQSN